MRIPIRQSATIRLMKAQVRVLFMLLVFASIAKPYDPWGWESLRGLKPFKLALVMGACPADLTMKIYKDINRDVESKLRVARILVDEKATFPLLILSLDCLRVKSGIQLMGYATHMSLSLSQYLMLNTDQRVVAVTWQAIEGRVCSVEECPNEISMDAKKLTDEFTNDLLKANEN